MTQVIFSSTAPKVKGDADINYGSLSVEEQPTSGSGTATSVINTADLSYTRYTITSAVNNCSITYASTAYNNIPKYTSLTPGVCTVTTNGVVSRVSDGEGKILVEHAKGSTIFNRTFQSATVVQDVFGQWNTGELAKHISDSILGMVTGKTPGATTQQVLSSSSGGVTTPVHIRNPSLFTGGLSLEAISVYTEQHGSNIFPCVLITPGHIITGHAAPEVGKKVVFKGSDGSYAVRTIVAQTALPSAVGDNFAGVLDSPITTVTPAKLLPSTWRSYLPSFNYQMYPLPVLNKGYTAGDYIRVLQTTRATTLDTYIGLTRVTDGPFSTWSSAIVGGDSNGPVFVPINGELVLLHCMNFSNGGWMYSTNISGIQTILNNLSTSAGKNQYNITHPNLSAFTAH